MSSASNGTSDSKGGWSSLACRRTSRPATCASFRSLQSVQRDAALPHKLFQYMLMGKPVVASACVEMSRVIEESGCGLLFPPGDSDALAEALIRLTDAEIRAELGEHGRQAVHDRYDWSRSAVKLLEMYDKPHQGAGPVCRHSVRVGADMSRSRNVEADI